MGKLGDDEDKNGYEDGYIDSLPCPLSCLPRSHTVDAFSSFLEWQVVSDYRTCTISLFACYYFLLFTFLRSVENYA